MPKEINIIKVLYPKTKVGVLKADKQGTLKTVIIDAELDDIKCTFNYDDCVELDTDGYSYISLSRDNLYQLIRLIEKSEKQYNKKFKKEEL
jgi:hypothetical protein